MKRTMRLLLIALLWMGFLAEDLAVYNSVPPSQRQTFGRWKYIPGGGFVMWILACHSQCSHGDRACQERCFARGDCPHAD